ncbi:MAG: class D sortase [Acidobacteria bacterium]|nr:class D sortase [Acidobacteriota bacterium]
MSRRWLRRAWIALAALGVGALSYSVWFQVSGRIFEGRAAQAFDERMRLSLPSPAAPEKWDTPGTGGDRKSEYSDGVIGRLEIPRIGVSVMVVEGVTDGDLRRAAGHVPGTALPDAPGNVAIAAHRDTFFRPLRFVRRDDVVILRTPRRSYRYRVVSTKVVRPEDVEVLYPASRDRLTLITCYPFDWFGAAPERFIVRAERVAPPRPPAAS